MNCAECGAPIERGKMGRPRKYCGDQCREKAKPSHANRTGDRHKYYSYDETGPPTFIGLDGESVNMPAVYYHETKRGSLEVGRARAFERWQRWEFAAEQWADFGRAVRFAGGLKLAGPTRADWVNVTPVHLRRRDGLAPDVMAEWLATAEPQLAVHDSGDLAEQLARYTVWLADRKTVRRVAPAAMPENALMPQPDKYVLLAASDGTEIADFENGLGTEQCLNYLLDLARRHGTAERNKRRAAPVRFLWFGSRYDVAMILKDLPRDKWERLWTYKTCRYWPAADWHHYYLITWTPGKKFGVSWWQVGEGGKPDKKLAGFSSDDVFGFCQSGFVPACIGWQILEPDSTERRFLDEMKSERGQFAGLAESEAGRARLREYNRLEVDLLAQMGRKIYDVHLAVGLTLTSFHGAGATAGLLLKKYNVAAHLNQDLVEQQEDIVMRAYFGGRIQLLRQGETKRLFGYDVNSAYPAAAVNLPSLAGAEWRHVDRFTPGRWGVYHVVWDCSPLEDEPAAARHALYPFPVRARGSIYWPVRGEGWYWQDEIAAALKWFPDLVVVLEGWELDIADETKPCSFLADLYKQRREYKEGATYNIAERVLKLGPNSVYGKFAEGAHLYGGPNAEPRRPRHQSYIYAGMITSACRAQVLNLAMGRPRDIVGFTTDGVWSRAAIAVETGVALGGWDSKEGANALFLQAGFYGYQAGEKWVGRTRGINPNEVDWDLARAAWRENRPLVFDSVRFVGPGRALASGEKWRDLLCTWQPERRHISFDGPKMVPVWHNEDSPAERKRFGFSRPLCTMVPAEISAPFKPKGLTMADDMLAVTLEEESGQRYHKDAD